MGISPWLTSFSVSRATGVCLTYAGAAARSELSKRPLTAQVRSACRHQHHPIPQWAVEPQPPEPHFPPPAPLPGHGLLFKTKLERSLVWKGAQPRLQEPQQAGPGEPGGFPEVVGSALA